MVNHIECHLVLRQGNDRKIGNPFFGSRDIGGAASEDYIAVVVTGRNIGLGLRGIIDPGEGELRVVPGKLAT